MNWFSVRCVFEVLDTDHDEEKARYYEERVLLWRSGSIEQALESSEQEAESYAREMNLKYLGLAQAYELAAETLTSGIEVFSLIRASELEPQSYIRRHFASEAELERTTSSQEGPAA